MKFDICSVGSALVDFTFNIDKDYEKNLIKYGIPKGSMTLIEREEQETLINELMEMGKTPDKACGGSGTNSTVAASLFGAKCHMTCIVSDDDHGRFYIEDLSSNNVVHTNPPISSEISSGRCLVMVSDDAERTMCTNLGISTEFKTTDLDEDVIKASNYLFLEGYLVASPKGMEACKKAIEVAKGSGTKVSISLSDPNIVNAFKNEIKTLLDMKCDLVFCNEDEALAYTEKDNILDEFDFFNLDSPQFDEINIIMRGSLERIKDPSLPTFFVNTYKQLPSKFKSSYCVTSDRLIFRAMMGEPENDFYKRFTINKKHKKIFKRKYTQRSSLWGG